MIKHILYVVSECLGFASTGGLADVAFSLPEEINKKNEKYKVHVIMPLYKEIWQKYNTQLKLIGSKIVQLSWRNNEIKLYYLEANKTNYYFIANSYYYGRDNLYGYHDDIERFAFFSKAVLECFELFNFPIDIIHANDWHAALSIIYYKLQYFTQYPQIKTILTIHNIQYQGVFIPEHFVDLTGLKEEHMSYLLHFDLVNLLKGAIVLSDYITTVSPSYAKEIQTPEYAYGLNEVICNYKDKLIGVLNGIDIDFYNPEQDLNIYTNFSSEKLDKRIENKIQLQKDLAFPINPNIPLLAIVSRLVDHKGMDLIIESMNKLLKNDIQLVVLGKGDKNYEEQFIKYEQRYPHKVRVLIIFDVNLAKKIYASTDLFLMPSKSEPCGLSQMIACRYGAIPIVRKTGGLGDSIKDYNSNTGNGFVFEEYSSNALINKINQALRLYSNQEEFRKLRKLAMTTDFSWQKSSQEYLDLYQKLLAK